MWHLSCRANTFLSYQNIYTAALYESIFVQKFKELKVKSNVLATSLKNGR